MAGSLAADGLPRSFISGLPWRGDAAWLSKISDGVTCPASEQFICELCAWHEGLQPASRKAQVCNDCMLVNFSIVSDIWIHWYFVLRYRCGVSLGWGLDHETLPSKATFKDAPHQGERFCEKLRQALDSHPDTCHILKSRYLMVPLHARSCNTFEGSARLHLS